MISLRDNRSFIGGDIESCPPATAQSCCREDLYRCLKYGDKPKSWLSRLKLGQEWSEHKCKESALSLCVGKKGVDQFKENFPKFANTIFAKLEIREQDGVLEINDATLHASWWHPVTLDPSTRRVQP